MTEKTKILIAGVVGLVFGSIIGIVYEKNRYEREMENQIQQTVLGTLHAMLPRESTAKE